MDAFQRHQEAVYSGKYIHPETEKNMPTTPPLPEPEEEERKRVRSEKDRVKKLEEALAKALEKAANPPVIYKDTFDPVKIDASKKRSKAKPKKLALFALIIALLLLATTLTFQSKEIEGYIDVNIEGFVDKIVSGVRDALPERVIEERVKVVRVNEVSQQAALAKIKAWKELNERLIHNHYNNKNLKGRRSLCLTLGNKEQCSIINTYTIRPELPPYLRRDLELK